MIPDFEGNSLPLAEQLLKIRNYDDMMGYVLKTAPAVTDGSAAAYALAIDNRMQELKLLPEHHKIIIATIADRSTSATLTGLTAEEMAQNSTGEDAKASWRSMLSLERR